MFVEPGGNRSRFFRIFPEAVFQLPVVRFLAQPLSGRLFPTLFQLAHPPPGFLYANIRLPGRLQGGARILVALFAGSLLGLKPGVSGAHFFKRLPGGLHPGGGSLRLGGFFAGGSRSFLFGIVKRTRLLHLNHQVEVSGLPARVFPGFLRPGRLIAHLVRLVGQRGHFPEPRLLGFHVLFFFFETTKGFFFLPAHLFRFLPLLRRKQFYPADAVAQLGVSFFSPDVLLIDGLGDGGEHFGAGEFFEQGGFFALVSFEKSGEVILGQQHRTGELAECKADELYDAGLYLLAVSLLFGAGIEVLQGDPEVLQGSVFLVARPAHCPAGPVPVAVQGDEIYFGIPRGGTAAQQVPGVALGQGRIFHVGQPYFVFFRLVGTGGTGEQGEAHGVEQRGFSGSGRAGYGIDSGRGQRLGGEIEFELPV